MPRKKSSDPKKRNKGSRPSVRGRSFGFGRKRLESWEKEVLSPALARGKERRRTFPTTSGIDVLRLYTPGDLEWLDYEKDLGFPGIPPFTRGIQPTMYRGRFWT